MLFAVVVGVVVVVVAGVESSLLPMKAICDGRSGYSYKFLNEV